MEERLYDMPTREAVETMLLDPELCGAGDEEMPIGKILIFSAFVGERDSDLAVATGLTVEQVFMITSVLIANGVFGADIDHYDDYFVNEHSGTVLNCDIACGKDMLERSKNEQGAATWKMTAPGIVRTESELLSKPAAQELMDKLTAEHGMKPGEWKERIKS